MSEFALPSDIEINTKNEDAGYVPGVEHDRWGRYLLPYPSGDPANLLPWTRVTTLVGLLEGGGGLATWGERKLAQGLALRPDLRARLVTEHADVKAVDEVRESAKEAAGATAARTWGTAVHKALELSFVKPEALHLDWDSDPLALDVKAARECLTGNGVMVVMLEAVVLHEMLGYAGRLDAIWEVTLPDGRTVRRIGDVKTGGITRKEARLKIAAQLAAYAHATHVYDPAKRLFATFGDDLDLDVGMVLHVKDGKAELYEVDISNSMSDVRLALGLQRRRRDGSDFTRFRTVSTHSAPLALSSPPISDEPVIVAPETREPGYSIPQPPQSQSLEERVEAVKSERKRAPRRCSICREPGHFARNCPTLQISKDAPRATWGDSIIETFSLPAPASSTPEPAPEVDDIALALEACTTRYEISTLWSANIDRWEEKHTELAKRISEKLSE